MRTLVCLLLVASSSACSTITPDAARVRVVSPASVKEASTCRTIRSFARSSAFGLDSVLNELREEAAEQGANVISARFRTDRSALFGESVFIVGKTFRCSKDIIRSIASQE